MNEGFLTLVEEQSNLDPIMYQYFNHYKNHRTIIFNRAVDESIVETVILPLKEFCFLLIYLQGSYCNLIIKIVV